MDLNEFHKEAQANAQRQQDIMRHQMEVAQERNLQQSLHAQTLNFQKEQTDRFIKEYKETNLRLSELNQSLQRQIDEQQAQITAEQNEIKRNKISSWIQFTISSLIALGGVIVAIIALVLKVS